MKFVTRLNIILVLFTIQIIGSIFLLYRIFLRFPIINMIGIILSVMAFLVIIKSNKPSSFKLSWVIIILGVLPLGGLFYLLYGNKRATKSMKKQVDEHALIADQLKQEIDVKTDNPRMNGLLAQMERSSGYRAYVNTHVEYFPMGQQMFDAMKSKMMTAKKFIFLEYFIVSEGSMWDELLEIMLLKARDGVDIRLIVDDFGSMKLFTNRYISSLRNQGIKIVRFNPMRPILFMFMNHRDHRKILIVDGHASFTGGMNIADEYINRRTRFGSWKDNGVLLEGPAVWSFTLMFIEMWDTFCKPSERIDDYENYRFEQEATASNGLVVPFGDCPLDHEQVGENVYVDILNQAKDYVYIFTPYLVISQRMTYALQMAVERGVDVRIITPGIPDKKLIFRLTRSYYRFLLDSGVRIYEYTPGFMHAKSFVSDDSVAVIGTINLDYRSLYLHFECATLLYKDDVIKEIKDDVLDTIYQCTEIKQRVGKWTPLGAFTDAILHLISPLL